MQTSYKDGYRYNEQWYYCGKVLCQIGEGIGLPKRTTLTAPGNKPECWYKYNNVTNAWDEEPYPKTAEDLQGVYVPFNDSSERSIYLRNLMEELTSFNQDSEYYIEKGPFSTNGREYWSLRKYTEEALLNRARERKQQDLQAKYYTEMNSCTVTVELSDGKSLTLSTSSETLQTLATALSLTQCGVQFDWVDDAGKVTTITKGQDVLACITAINKHNTEATKKWGEYKQQIEAAMSTDVLDEIEIDFHADASDE